MSRFQDDQEIYLQVSKVNAQICNFLILKNKNKKVKKIKVKVTT